MINILAGAGRICLSIAGLAIVVIGVVFTWNATKDPGITFLGGLLSLIVAGALLGPLAALYKISDDISRLAKGDQTRRQPTR